MVKLQKEINEFDNEQATENFKKYRELVSQIDVSAIVEVRNSLDKVKNKNQIEILDDMLNPFKAVGQKCPKCGELLFVSDLPQYEFVCYNCQENFC